MDPPPGKRYHGRGVGQSRQPPGDMDMIQCKDCEFFRKSESGEVAFLCDPFTNVKEPDCLGKWQLIKINQMVAAYHATLEYYHKLAPMQEKMFKVMEREIDDMSESEKWKAQDDLEAEDGDDDDDEPWKSSDPSDSSFM
jgi:hypothetical protein